MPLPAFLLPVYSYFPAGLPDPDTPPLHRLSALFASSRHQLFFYRQHPDGHDCIRYRRYSGIPGPRRIPRPLSRRKRPHGD